MQWYQVVGISASIIGVASAALAVLRHLIVHEIRQVGAELKPNGGKSFRDEVHRRFDAVQKHLWSQDDRLNGIDDRINGLDERVTREHQ